MHNHSKCTFRITSYGFTPPFSPHPKIKCQSSIDIGVLHGLAVLGVCYIRLTAALQVNLCIEQTSHPWKNQTVGYEEVTTQSGNILIIKK